MVEAIIDRKVRDGVAQRRVKGARQARQFRMSVAKSHLRFNYIPTRAIQVVRWPKQGPAGLERRLLLF